MSQLRTHARSFAGGEITPELYGRIDLVKFQTGLAHCENVMVLPHGPATRRPGFEYILQAKRTDSVRLIPFSFNTEQTYTLEVGNFYMRFHTNRATVLEAAVSVTSISQGNPGVVTYSGTDPAEGAWVFFAGVSGMTEVNGRFLVATNVNTTANTFELCDLRGNIFDTTSYSAGTGGTMQSVYEIATPYTAAQVFDLNFTQDADVMTLVHRSHPPKILTRTSATTFTLTDVSFNSSISAPTGLTVVQGGTPSVSLPLAYKVTAVAEDTFEESDASDADFVSLDLTTAAGTGLQTALYGKVTWDPPPAGETITRYNIYKAISDGAGNEVGVYGFIGQTETLEFRDYQILPDYSVTPPVSIDPFVDGDTYPSAVSYFEQRKAFGGTNSQPQNYWLTRSGTESSISRSLPTLADDAILGRIVASQVNEIRHFVPLNELLVLTVGGEWALGSSDSGALTPLTLRVRTQSYQGASKVVPQVTGTAVLYVQAAGSRVHELAYSWENTSYKSADISLMAPHLVDEHTIVDMAFTRAPDQILWCIRDDGVLLGCTYVPDHQVIGWHQHTTDGNFKSISVVVEDDEYVPYVVIERTIDGDTVQNIERMHDRHFSELADWFGVDSGLTYEGVAADTFTGLWHLEGKTVHVLGDGAVFPPQVVVNGSITISTEVTKAHIGLSAVPLVKLLPMSFQAADHGHGLAKNPGNAYLRINKSSGVQIGPDLDNLITYPQRTTEGYGSPPDMVSEEIQILISEDWGQDGDVWITQDAPLPLTLTAISLEVEVSE